MKFKVLLRKTKRGGARARAAGRELFLEIRPFDGSCFLCLSIMLHDTAANGTRGRYTSALLVQARQRKGVCGGLTRQEIATTLMLGVSYTTEINFYVER